MGRFNFSNQTLAQLALILSPPVVLQVTARTARCGVGCCTALRGDRHGPSIRAISLLEQRRIAHIASAPTGTVSLRETWRGRCNQEGCAYGRSKDRNGKFAHRDYSF